MEQEIIRIDLQVVNCFLVNVRQDFILIDTGGPVVMDKIITHRTVELERALLNAGCQPGNLKLILLTHGDCDHVANAAFLREKYRTKIAMHQGDLGLVADPTFEAAMRSFQFRKATLKMLFWLFQGPIESDARNILEGFSAFQPDIFLDEGDSLREYGFEATVLHIPGHTQGSIAFLTAFGDLICGDTLVNSKKPGAAINAHDFKALDASVERLKNLPVKTVYPGHGAPFEMREVQVRR